MLFLPHFRPQAYGCSYFIRSLVSRVSCIKMQLSAEKGFSTPWSNPLISSRTIQPHKSGFRGLLALSAPGRAKAHASHKMAVMPFASRFPKGRGSSLRPVGGAGHVILLRGSNVWPAPFIFLCAPFGHLPPPAPPSAANGPGAYPAAVLSSGKRDFRLGRPKHLVDNRILKNLQ